MIYLFFPIIASILYGISIALYEKVVHGSSVLSFMLIGGIFSIVSALVLAALKVETLSFDFTTDKVKTILIIIATTVPLIGWYLSIYAIKHVPASYVAFAEISYPLFTVLFLFLFFGIKHFDWSFIVGGALVLIGSSILIYGQARQMS